MQEKWKNRYITNVHTSLTKKNILIVKVKLFLTVIYLPSLKFTEMHYRFWQVFWTPYSTRTEILNEGSIGNRNIKFQNKYLGFFFHFLKAILQRIFGLTLLFFISRCQYYYLLFYLDVSLLLFNKTAWLLFPSDLFFPVSHDIIYLTLSRKLVVLQYANDEWASYFEMYQWFY